MKGSAAGPGKTQKVREAADYLGVTPQTLRRMVRRGQIRARLYCGAYHFKPEDLVDFLEAALVRPGDKVE